MRKRRFPIQRVVFTVTVFLLLVLVVFPLIKIVNQSFIHDGRYSLGNFREVFGDRDNYVALFHSFQVSFGAMVGATLVGTFLAWLVARTNIPNRALFRTAFIFPFIMPPFVGALAWLQILGPAGYLNKAYMALTGSGSPLWNIYGPDGIILVMVFHGVPLVFITVIGALERMNPELEEVAQASGARPYKVMLTVTLPLMLPSIAGGAILVFIHSMANFGIPAILGFQENYYVLTTKIWEAITLTFGLSLAASLSVLLGVIAGLGLLLQRFLLRKRTFAVLTGKSMYPNLVDLGGHRNWLAGLATFWILVTAAAPILAIVLTALTRAYGLPPVPGNLTLGNFIDMLKDEAAIRAIRNSIFLAVSAATIITTLGALIAYIVVKTRLKMRGTLDLLATVPYAIPGSVVALAMILAWLNPFPFWNFSLYNTIWILLIAYIARYLTFGVRATSGALTQIHESLEEVAQVSGANWLQTFRDVIIPLITPGLFAGWFLVFMPSLRELTISAILWSPGNETIGVIVFNLQESGNTTEAAALAVVMMLVLLMANLVTRRLTKGRIGY